MRFMSKCFNDTLCIYARGNGENASVRITYLESYDEPANIHLEIKDAETFLTMLAEAIEDAKKRALDKDEEND